MASFVWLRLFVEGVNHDANIHFVARKSDFPLAPLQSLLREGSVLHMGSTQLNGFSIPYRLGLFMNFGPNCLLDRVTWSSVSDTYYYVWLLHFRTFKNYSSSNESFLVTSLNLEIVRALAKEGIPSIGMSPFSCGWSTRERNIAVADLSTVAKAIDNGFVPVLHGDAVLDTSLDCTILSGDVIIRHLVAELKPDYVVFLTDVFGVYDRPPTEPDAVLLREIAVREDGSWFVVKPELQDMNRQVEITVAAHDTTGGMVTKISEAAMIAKHAIDVYIVKAATDHSLKALRGDLKENIPDDWLGTVIRLAK
ncbi:uncharacterized protein LOC111398337 [Olea europaea var. sylvestris]|uniref:uncharacterized protein LOC111398337 n=1 Tax=Olea europaea var. sylvestris TaxID=158386 RepID=UPI000C1D5AA4|nr:uncharacterized protein LOC111398337 [Olea europaea var. sylvestris]